MEQDLKRPLNCINQLLYHSEKSGIITKYLSRRPGEIIPLSYDQPPVPTKTPDMVQFIPGCTSMRVIPSLKPIIYLPESDSIKLGRIRSGIFIEYIKHALDKDFIDINKQESIIGYQRPFIIDFRLGKKFDLPDTIMRYNRWGNALKDCLRFVCVITRDSASPVVRFYPTFDVMDSSDQLMYAEYIINRNICLCEGKQNCYEQYTTSSNTSIKRDSKYNTSSHLMVYKQYSAKLLTIIPTFGYETLEKKYYYDRPIFKHLLREMYIMNNLLHDWGDELELSD